MGQFAAGIVLYNPEIGRLKENIDTIQRQVQKVYCYDNASKNKLEIKELLSKYDNIIYIPDNQNVGIATAINRIVGQSKLEGITWLLTLDQDSICPENMINEFEQYIHINEVAIICPLMIDKRRPIIEIPHETCSDVDFCITSGSFMNLELFDKIGKMDEYLFVGLVDDDFCFRIKLLGYKIIQINSVVLDHELGDLIPKRLSAIYLKIGEFFNSNIIKSLSYKRHVSPMRIYYATRNIVYLSNKFSKPPKKFRKTFAIQNGVISIIRGKEKIKIANAIIVGYRDGSNV